MSRIGISEPFTHRGTRAVVNKRLVEHAGFLEQVLVAFVGDDFEGVDDFNACIGSKRQPHAAPEGLFSEDLGYTRSHRSDRRRMALRAYRGRALDSAREARAPERTAARLVRLGSSALAASHVDRQYCTYLRRRERSMPVHEVRVDYTKRLAEEPGFGHNRWHPGIAPALNCEAGEEVVLETRDGVDLQLSVDSTSDDVAKLNLRLVHPLTGPVYLEGAEPGDLLDVEILEVLSAPFGFTIQIPGVGFLRDLFPEAHLTRWDISNGFATSPDLPHVRIPGAPFMGIMGVAPSSEMIARFEAREREIELRGGLALPPEPTDAVPSDARIAREGLRTIPPRENGGNVDTKQITAGTHVLLPVWVDGALFSAGDAHFAQGDGEACGTAIEVSGTLRARLHLRKGEAAARNIRGLQFERREGGPTEALGRFFATTGIPVDPEGRNHAEDLTMAARDALLNMIEHLQHEYGLTGQQAYTLCSVAVDLRVSEIVDVPNFVVSAILPLDIFA
jgi:formamidase